MLRGLIVVPYFDLPKEEIIRVDLRGWLFFFISSIKEHCFSFDLYLFLKCLKVWIGCCFFPCKNTRVGVQNQNQTKQNSDSCATFLCSSRHVWRIPYLWAQQRAGWRNLSMRLQRRSAALKLWPSQRIRQGIMSMHVQKQTAPRFLWAQQRIWWRKVPMCM